ncbi:MAG: AcrR family transcriptional regulator [Glaciecola sp.]
MARDPADRATRRAALLDAADRAIVRHGPGVTMDDIAAEAGITKPILYRHFGAKGGLYEALARRSARLLGEQLETALAQERDWRRRVVVTLDTYLAAIERQPQLYRFLLNRASAERPEVTAALGDFTQQFATLLAKILAEEFEGAGFALPNPPLIAAAIVGAAQQAGEWWLADGTVAREDVVDQLAQFVWRGLPALGGME